MSFWLNKPLHVKNIQHNLNNKFSSDLIKSPDDLLKDCIDEINKSKIKLDYNIIMDPNDECKNHLLKFINNNYDTSNSHLVLQYSKSLLDYFINNDSLCIIFYPKGHGTTKPPQSQTTNKNKCNFDKMVGLIIAKKHTLSILENTNTPNYFKNYETIDADFLCLIKPLRNLHISSYMINIVTKECLVQYNKQVCSAIYTINKPIKVPHFSRKTFYHRPLNINELISSDMLNIESTNENVYKKIYNTFNYHKNFFTDCSLEYYNYIQNVDDSLLDFIYDKLLTYNKTNYHIFESKSKEDVKKMLQNPVFHKFIIKNKSNEIIDFICLYNLNTLNKNTNTFIRCGHFYSFFLHDNSNSYIYNILEIISEYCYKHNLFDELIIMNILNIPCDKYKLFKLLKGSGQLFYYIYNIDIPFIHSHQNGLVTI
jgi:hypothetical protein